MSMRTFSLCAVAALLAMTASVQADHRTWKIEIKGKITANDGEGGIQSQSVSTQDLLTSPGNYLVAEVDADPETIDFTIEEWADSNEDGTPDTPVDRDPITLGVQSEVFVRHSMAALEDGKFIAVLETGNEVDEFQGSLVVDGKMSFDGEGDQSSFKGKVSGPVNDPDLGGSNSVIFKGTIKSVGSPILLF